MKSGKIKKETFSITIFIHFVEIEWVGFRKVVLGVKEMCILPLNVVLIFYNRTQMSELKVEVRSLILRAEEPTSLLSAHASGEPPPFSDSVPNRKLNLYPYIVLSPSSPPTTSPSWPQQAVENRRARVWPGGLQPDPEPHWDQLGWSVMAGWQRTWYEFIFSEWEFIQENLPSSSPASTMCRVISATSCHFIMHAGRLFVDTK